MSRRPALEKFPHLHSILKKDAVANTQFNEALRDLNVQVPLQTPVVDSAGFERLQKAYSELVDKYNAQTKHVQKTNRLIRVLGGVIETQCPFTPYVDDILAKKSYSIKFSAGQVRMLLHKHWDIIATQSEEILLNQRDSLDDNKDLEDDDE